MDGTPQTQSDQTPTAVPAVAQRDLPPLPSSIRRRRRVLTVLGVAALLALGVAVYWYVFQRNNVYTDNAYVGGNIVQVTPQVGGTVVSIHTDDTQLVSEGQALVQLDQTDAQASLKAAEAALGNAVRSVRELYAREGVARSVLAVRRADIARARAEVDRAKADEIRAAAEYERRQALVAKGFVSGENLQNAKSALDAASAQRAAAESALAESGATLTQAQHELTSTQVLVDATDVANHPRVQQAAAGVREAYLALARTAILAPVSGYVARRSVQLGQRVAAGTPLMSIIPAEKMWVDANFKESQLADVRIGQPVKLTADLYGGSVDYDGRVVGLSAGTGAAFALLPPQNATGNWIKIVQRVPVRVALDPHELRDHPLRIGLSMRVTVDTHDRSGPVLATQAQPDPPYTTDVYANQAHEADALIAKIVRANLGGSDSSPAKK
jgi:membrane fusion protein (multidrug efflux system)